jgi:hypothetical protein
MFDSVFHGSPTSVGGQSISSGRASLGLDAASGTLYFRTPENGGWQPCSGTSSGTIQVARVVLTAAQVVAAYGAAPTPNFPVIIPAPGAGKLLNPINIFLEWKSGVAMSVGSGTFELSLYQTVPTPTLLYWMGNVATSGFFNTTGTTVLSNSSTVGDEAEIPFNSTTPFTYINCPLVFVNEDGGLSGGSAGTLTITVLYNVITMS